MKMVRQMILALAALGASVPALAVDSDYHKASDDDEVVKDKMFTKAGKVELNPLNIGGILNQSYVNTFLIDGSINYFTSETWGFGIEGAIALNSDKDSRTCIENFYNDPNSDISHECGTADTLNADKAAVKDTSANFGPGYTAIREIKYLVGGNVIWSPIYGKQLLMMRGTSYFDLFLVAGAGLAMSDYYPEQPTLKNGKPSRGDGTVGADPSDTGSYGIDGRPLPESQTNPMIDFGIGQKFHFMKRFHVKAELRNYTLLGTNSGFDNFFTLWGGFGVRF